MTPETAQEILEAVKPAWDHVVEAVKQINAAFGELVQPVIDGIATILGINRAIMAEATPQERHYILHAKRRRVRKKYYDRVRRRVLARTVEEDAQ